MGLGAEVSRQRKQEHTDETKKAGTDKTYNWGQIIKFSLNPILTSQLTVKPLLLCSIFLHFSHR